MGTNFYLHTKTKSLAERIGDFELTDTPDWGYEVHIAKTSSGWLPLFQAHAGIRSVSDIKNLVLEEGCEIYDEYDNKYKWEEFVERVLKFNGGVKGAIPSTPYKRPKDTRFDDPDMPDYLPVSHFDYGNGKYADNFFKDAEGYEFDTREFC